jgi:glutaredoxin
MKTSTFFILIAVAGGTLENRDKIAYWLNPPPAISQENGQNEVILYSTTWCGYCAKTRKFFAENHIKYTDLDVEKSEQGRKDYERLGGNGVPIVIINREIAIRGYNPEAITDALNRSEIENAKKN